MSAEASEGCRACPARVLGEAAHLLGASLNEMVPPDAQRHLITAQRELFLAVALTIEHNASRGTGRSTPAREQGAARARRRPSRVELD